MKYYIVILFVSLLCATSCSIGNAKDDNTHQVSKVPISGSQNVASTLKGEKFGSLLGNYNYDTIDQLGKPEFSDIRQTRQTMLTAVRSNVVKDGELTILEVQRLAFCDDLAGRAVGPFKFVGSINQYYQQNGRLPSSGLELCMFFVPDEFVRDYDTFSLEDKLFYCAPYVNSISGKILGSFSNQSGKPGEVHIRLIDDQEVMEQEFGVQTIPTDILGISGETAAATKMMVVTIFGETEGEAIYVYHRPFGAKK